MVRCRLGLAAVVAVSLAPGARAQAPSQPPQPGPIVTAIHVTGAGQLSERESLEAMHVRAGQPLPDDADRLAQAVERHYHDEGYTFAKARATFDAASGALDVTIDEGVIDAVEFEGVPDPVARRVADDFALRAGDVFNRRRALQALKAALMPTRGAVAAGRVQDTITDSRDVEQGRTFDLVDRGGRRVLVVGLRERSGRFRLAPDFGDREDWFTPVDGLVPSLGFGIVAFDHQRFNHTFIAGHVSLKLATKNMGYAIGFERPLFGGRKLYIGAEARDLTATDDRWQLTSTEASFDAVSVRKNFRNYFERRGVQAMGAWRVDPHVEVIGLWRSERERPLQVQSDFSFIRRDEAFRPNLQATDGHLNALVLGATFDSAGFERESLEATYRRHQLDTMFGEALTLPDPADDAPVWRIDWTSEISAPGAFASDFDFSRHIVGARLRKSLGAHQDVGVRGIGGWSGGILPPQRQFSAGGIGSVHGYDVDEQVGDSLALLNLEYSAGWRRGIRAIGFFDVGRASASSSAPASPDAPWLKGFGFGFALGRDDDLRVDFGYRLAAGPGPLQVIVRFGRSF